VASLFDHAAAVGQWRIGGAREVPRRLDPGADQLLVDIEQGLPIS
jgi:hypothetical protein